MAEAAVVHVLHFPTSMLREIEREAIRRGKSISDCLGQAWGASRQHLQALTSDTPTGGGRLITEPKKAQRAELTASVWREVDRQAWRLDRSKSWVFQQAWLAAKKRGL